MARSSPESTTAITPFRGSSHGGTLTEADARKLLEEHARSGRSLQSFAEIRGLPGERLGWWRGRFHDANAASPAPRVVPQVSFVPMTLAPAAATTSAPLSWSDPPPAALAPATTSYELVLGFYKVGHTAGENIRPLRRHLSVRTSFYPDALPS